MNIINEFTLRLLPIFIKRSNYINALSSNIHTSEYMKSYIINMVKTSVLLKPIYKSILKLIDENRIVIGYLSDNRIYMFLKKIFEVMHPNDSVKTLGLYDSDTDKLYLVLDDNVNILGDPKTELDSVLLHETMHYYFNKYNNELFNVCINLYFYDFFYYYIINLTKGAKIKSGLLIDTLVRLSKMESNNIYASIKPMYLLWSEFFIKHGYSKEESVKYVNFMFFPFMRYVVDNKEVTDKENSIKSLNLFVDSYRTIGFPNILNKTTPGQEALYISEILAITQEYGINPKIASIINSIT